jgi:hypothetical protein
MKEFLTTKQEKKKKEIQDVKFPGRKLHEGVKWRRRRRVSYAAL